MLPHMCLFLKITSCLLFAVKIYIKQQITLTKGTIESDVKVHACPTSGINFNSRPFEELVSNVFKILAVCHTGLQIQDDGVIDIILADGITGPKREPSVFTLVLVRWITSPQSRK